MGLTVHPLDEDVADQVGQAQTSRGLLVLSVDKTSSLCQQLHPYDVIEAVGRTPVSTLDELNQALELNSKRESIVLRIHRHNGSETGMEEQLVVWKRSPLAAGL